MPPEVEAQFQNRNNRMKIMESKEEYLRKLGTDFDTFWLISIQKKMNRNEIIGSEKK